MLAILPCRTTPAQTGSGYLPLTHLRWLSGIYLKEGYILSANIELFAHFNTEPVFCFAESRGYTGNRRSPYGLMSYSSCISPHMSIITAPSYTCCSPCAAVMPDLTHAYTLPTYTLPPGSGTLPCRALHHPVPAPRVATQELVHTAAGFRAVCAHWLLSSHPVSWPTARDLP